MKVKEQKNKNHLRIVNLDNYVSPDVSEKPSRDYVTFGNKNQFFQHLIDRSRGSVTNGGIISSVSNLIYGKGLDSNQKAMHPDQWAQLLTLFKPKDIKRMIRDFEITGQFAIQCQWQGGHKTIKTATHFPIETLAPEKVDEDGKIKNYFYAKDWLKVRSMNDLKKIPVLGTSKEGIEVLVVAPYEPGMFYFSLPKWFSAIQWAELEEEIVNYHLNGVQNSFAPSMFISMNNGIPQSEEEADEIVSRMLNKYQGSSNAGRVIVSFNTDKEHESTVVPIMLSDLPEQYQFLSQESAFKILTAHSITSPLLVGIPSSTGFSSNADELKVGSILLETNVINPKRITIIEAFEEITNINKITIDYHFESLNPFAEEEDVDIEADMKTQLSDEVDFNSILDNLKAGVLDDEWELVDVREFSEENTAIQDWAESKITQLAVIKSDPNAKSTLDKDLFKVRYQYNEGTTKKKSGSPSRDFCIQMMTRTRNGVVYRHDDIAQASFRGINKEHGHNGQNYSLFKYKGGVNCHHIWNEFLYRRKTKTNGEPFIDKALSSSEKVRSIPGFNPNPTGERESKIQPINMPNNGHHPNYKS